MSLYLGILRFLFIGAILSINSDLKARNNVARPSSLSSILIFCGNKVNKRKKQEREITMEIIARLIA